MPIYHLECTNAAGTDKWSLVVHDAGERDRVAQTWRDQGRQNIRVNGEAWEPGEP